MFERIADHPVIRRLREEGYPEERVCFYCRGCGGEIYAGNSFYSIDGDAWCRDCIDNCLTEAE